MSLLGVVDIAIFFILLVWAFEVVYRGRISFKNRLEDNIVFIVSCLSICLCGIASGVALVYFVIKNG